MDARALYPAHGLAGLGRGESAAGYGGGDGGRGERGGGEGGHSPSAYGGYGGYGEPGRGRGLGRDPGPGSQGQGEGEGARGTLGRALVGMGLPQMITPLRPAATPPMTLDQVIAQRGLDALTTDDVKAVLSQRGFVNLSPLDFTGPLSIATNLETIQGNWRAMEAVRTDLAAAGVAAPQARDLVRSAVGAEPVGVTGEGERPRPTATAATGQAPGQARQRPGEPAPTGDEATAILPARSALDTSPGTPAPEGTPTAQAQAAQTATPGPEAAEVQSLNPGQLQAVLETLPAGTRLRYTLDGGSTVQIAERVGEGLRHSVESMQDPTPAPSALEPEPEPREEPEPRPQRTSALAPEQPQQRGTQPPALGTAPRQQARQRSVFSPETAPDVNLLYNPEELRYRRRR